MATDAEFDAWLTQADTPAPAQAQGATDADFNAFLAADAAPTAQPAAQPSIADSPTTAPASDAEFDAWLASPDAAPPSPQLQSLQQRAERSGVQPQQQAQEPQDAGAVPEQSGQSAGQEDLPTSVLEIMRNQTFRDIWGQSAGETAQASGKSLAGAPAAAGAALHFVGNEYDNPQLYADLVAAQDEFNKKAKLINPMFVGLAAISGQVRKLTDAAAEKFPKTSKERKDNILTFAGQAAYEHWRGVQDELEGQISTSISNPEIMSGQWWRNSLAEAGTSMGVAMLLGGGNPTGAAVVGSIMEAGPFYEDLLEKKDRHAGAKALAFGVAVAALEKIGFDHIFKKMPPGILKKVLAKVTGGLAESGSEIAEEPVAKFIEIADKEGMTLTEKGKEVLGALNGAWGVGFPTFVLGLLGAGSGSTSGARADGSTQAEATTADQGAAQPPPIPTEQDVARVAPQEEAAPEATPPAIPIGEQAGPVTAEQVAGRAAIEQEGAPITAADVAAAEAAGVQLPHVANQEATAQPPATPQEVAAERGQAPRVSIDQTLIDTADRKSLRAMADQFDVSRNGPTESIRKRLQNINQSFIELENATDPFDKFIAAAKAVEPTEAVTKKLRKREEAKRWAKSKKILESKSGIDSIIAARAAKKGALPMVAGQPVNQFFNRQEIDSLVDRAKAGLGENATTAEVENAGAAIMRLMNENRLQPAERKLLGKMFGKDFADAIAKPRTFADKSLNVLMQSTGMVRTLKTMLDISAIARQGAIPAIANPGSVKKAFNSMSKGLFSDSNYQALYEALISDPRYPIADEAGLYLAPASKEGVALSQRDESFMSEWADKIPGAKISERAYNGYLNALRADLFYKFVDKYGDKADIADFKKQASWINEFTGRGGFKGNTRITKAIEEAMPLLSTGFFSPRWVLSRIQMPFTAITPVRDTATGKPRWSPANTEAMKSMGAYYGLMVTVLGIAAAAGADVEDDWRSSDFGKVKIGNTRFDLSAGLSQYLRFIGQMISGERKVLSSGKISPVERERLMYRFIRSKSSPMAGILWSALTGKTFIGDEFIPTGDEENAKWLAGVLDKLGAPKSVTNKLSRTGEILARELLPLIIQQTIDGIRADGLFGGLMSGAGEFIGIGTSSFKPRTQGRSRQRRSGRRSRGR